MRREVGSSIFPLLLPVLLSPIHTNLKSTMKLPPFISLACWGVVIATSKSHYSSAQADESAMNAARLPVLGVNDETDFLTREERFPSVEDRVKLYMGNWYAPPCGNDQTDSSLIDFFFENRTDDSIWPSLILSTTPYQGNATNYQIESVVEPDRVFFLDHDILMDCLQGDKGGQGVFHDRVLVRLNMLMYCFDAVDSLSLAAKHVQEEIEALEVVEPPILVQFGDLKHSHVYGDLPVPHFKKFRSATTQANLNGVTREEKCSLGMRQEALQTVHTTTKLQPIIWKLATARHFRMLGKMYREDTPWEQKKDKAVFRGQLTGSRDGYHKKLPDEVNCLNLRRCRLVYTHSQSKLINAKLTSTRNRMPNVLNNVSLTAPVTTIRRLLEYKAIIMLEGNDVASGLKWALLSQSVVLMPPPMHTSWAMEELLTPWVHYVPLNQNATDVEEKMQWVLNNDNAARRIAERASLWIEDLCFHPDAALDDRLIQEEIIRRYRAHFRKRARPAGDGSRVQG